MLRAPRYIADKLLAWVNLVETKGLAEARKIPGFRDHALAGKRRGQRAIRLSRSYRAVYTAGYEGETDVITVEEVHKHDY